MEQIHDHEKSNGCFAVVGQHPILLTIHAVSILLVGIYLLQSAPENPISNAAPTFGCAMKLWLTTILTLFGILLAGIFPGVVIEMAAMAVLGGRLLSPLLAPAYSGNHSCIISVALFIRILALLLTGVLAGSSSLQITRRWAEILALQMDLVGEKRVLDDPDPTLDDWKDLLQLFVRRLIRMVVPLSTLIAGFTVWLL